MLLARDQIFERLQSEDPEMQIFRPGSWKPSSVRGAAYDLRVAADYLILPNGKRFWPNSPQPVDRAYFAAFELKPGEVAFVSSVERLWMPWDLTGNIAPKFRLALDGLLVMGGMLIDPGYGRFKRKRELWVQRDEGERLHFQLANVGSSSFEIVPEETTIAAVQFVELTGDSRRKSESSERLEVAELEIPTSDKLLRDLFHAHAKEPLPQLQFFYRATEAQDRVNDIDLEVKANRLELEASKQSISWVVIATVLVLLITVFSVAMAALVNALS
jgi:deoxycytidine triphosphate deaminase